MSPHAIALSCSPISRVDKADSHYGFWFRTCSNHYLISVRRMLYFIYSGLELGNLIRAPSGGGGIIIIIILK